MKAFGVYSSAGSGWKLVLISKSYISCIGSVNLLTEAGKNCIIVEQEQQDLKNYFDDDDSPDPILFVKGQE